MKSSWPEVGQDMYDARRSRLIEQLDGASMLVSNLVNVQYLTGFTGSNAFLVANDSGTTLLTDGRYTEQAATECPDLPLLIRPVDSTMLNLIAGALKDQRIADCKIESESITRALWRDLVEAAKGEVNFLDSSGIVENLRAIKDDLELQRIRKSVAINEQILLDTLQAFDDGWTERDFAAHLEREIRGHGGDGFSFDPIVAAGPSSALPHYHASDPTIRDHDFVLVDWGTSFLGYASDLTRMVAIGEVPDEIRKIHSIVSDAKQAAIETIRDGVELQEVDQAARQLIADAGYGEQFNHGLGHGFGLEIHETPFLSPAFEGQLRAGMVITIEPGIYLPGLGGVRLEDDLLVTADGYEKLNSLPDDFLLL